MLLEQKRLTENNKVKKDFEWFKNMIDQLDVNSTSSLFSSYESGISEYKRMKVNYDLFNNIINVADFEYVCTPFGAEAGELPAQMTNKDICSNRIKAVEGMEQKRPFTWRVVAVNKEATTRREEAEFGKLRDYVISQIMGPIRQEIETKYAEQQKGQKLSDDEIKNIQQSIENEIQVQTPDEVRKYMERKHQDPAEVLANRILQYLLLKEDIERKFEKGLRHGLLSADEIYFVGILNGKPKLINVNPLRFAFDKSPDLDFIEDGEWATHEYRMTPSSILQLFGDQLTETEIDKIYSNAQSSRENILYYNLFNNNELDDPEINNNTNRVLHAVWKAPRKIGFLTYQDEDGEIQEDIVDENYSLNKENGDIKIEWKWIPDVYETFKIDSDIYVNMRRVPSHVDIDNIYERKLPYVGIVYDNLNSQPTSLMDRMKVYQYYYNIVMYRLELLLASDKGKKLLMNINAIPKESGIDIKKWQYFFESTPFAWYNPDEEGVSYSDVNTIGKVLDMSVASDLDKYISLAIFLEQQCGKSVGVLDATLGQISPSQEVGNTKQTIVQTSNILEPYFKMHGYVKRNALQQLINCAKIAYSKNPPKDLDYVLDDMSLRMLKMDIGLLESSTLGLFVSDTTDDAETLQDIKNMAHAALQNQAVEFSDVVTLIRQKDSQDAEEILKASEASRNIKLQAQKKMELEAKQASEEAQRQENEREHQRVLEQITVKEEERRKTEIQKQTILSMGFNENKDLDDDGTPDILEVAKYNVDADIKMRKQKLEESKFEQSKKEHEDKVKIENKKLSKPTKSK